MPNLNSITIAGHLGRDAETKTFPSGHSVTQFSVATSGGTKEKPKTAWHNVKWWGAPAEGKALVKGAAVVIVGQVEQESWEDKASGEKRTKDVINARIVAKPLYEKVERQEGAAQAPQFKMEITDDDVPF